VFPWNIELKQDKTKEQKHYVSNTSNAPLIEFSKTDWVGNNNGRLYWTKYFTGGPLEYDMTDFEKFYDTVVRWFIKNAEGKVKWAGVNVYYFADAWNRYTKKNGG
jgi:hypothetical protein